MAENKHQPECTEPVEQLCSKCGEKHPVDKATGFFFPHDPCYPEEKEPKGIVDPGEKSRQTGKPNKYAYEIKDRNVGSLKILNSANAWWLDSLKVNDLIKALKTGATDDEAMFYIGITRHQLEYFQKLHPDFYGVKHACKQNLSMAARIRLAEEVDKDLETAKWYLARKHKSEFSTRQEVAGVDGRDLFDGLTARLKELNEDLENGKTETKKEHTDEPTPGDADAGHDRAGNEAETTVPKPEA